MMSAEVLLRCPFPQCLGLGLYRVFSQLVYAMKRGVNWTWREPAWWWQAAKGIPECWRRRRPIPWAKYKAWLEIE